MPTNYRARRSVLAARVATRDLHEQVADLYEQDRALCVTAVMDAAAGRESDPTIAEWEAYDEAERLYLQSWEAEFYAEHGYEYDYAYEKWLEREREWLDAARWEARYGMSWQDKTAQEEAMWAAHRVC